MRLAILSLDSDYYRLKINAQILQQYIEMSKTPTIFLYGLKISLLHMGLDYGRCMCPSVCYLTDEDSFIKITGLMYHRGVDVVPVCYHYNVSLDEDSLS